MKIAVFSHPDCLRHDTGPGHPECIERLSVVLGGLKTCGYSHNLEFIDAPLGTKSQVLLVHTPQHYERIEKSVPDRGSYAALDPDTILSHDSFQAALRAVGAGCEAVDKVMAGTYETAFCAMRPPGHHATPNKAMGFCLFNNVAIAAVHAINTHGLKRVAIVDFDVHHGNGTQDAFEQDTRVLYVSTHEQGNYPGTGSAEEKGAGNILNLPLPSGANGALYRKIFSNHIMPTLRKFEPQLVLASAGFDAHKDDPLAGLALDEDDYEWIGERLRIIASEYCNGKAVSFLEGGYNLQALKASVISYLSAFTAV